MLQMYARACFVHRVNSLIGHETVVDVSGCQFDTSLDGFVSIRHMVVILIAALDVLQNLQRLVVGGWLYLYLLESALQGTVFLNRVAVLVECGGADALYGTTSQGRFQNVGRIHRTGS